MSTSSSQQRNYCDYRNPQLQNVFVYTRVGAIRFKSVLLTQSLIGILTTKCYLGDLYYQHFVTSLEDLLGVMKEVKNGLQRIRRLNFKVVHSSFVHITSFCVLAYFSSKFTLAARVISCSSTLPAYHYIIL